MKTLKLLRIVSLLVLACVFSQESLVAQVRGPAAQIAEGRRNLAKQTSDGILAAHRNFDNALKVAPNNAEANFLFAASLFLREHASEDLHKEVQAVGAGVIDPNPYDAEFSYPVDRRGRFAPFRFAGSGRSISYLVAKEALAKKALSHLQKIQNSGFRTVLTEKETSLLGATVDFADVRILRAILLTSLAGLDMAQVYNLEAEYFGIYRRAVTPGLTPEMVFKAYPTVLGFTGKTAKRLSARVNLIAANEELQAALKLIAKRQATNPPNLFEIGLKDDAANLAAVCAALAKSLTGVTTIPDLQGAENPLEERQINLSKAIDSPSPPRTWFPDAFDRGFIRPGSWKDHTLGGVFPDASKADLDEAALGLGILQNTFLERYRFKTIAGRAGIAGYRGAKNTALFGDIRGLTVDAAGNLYVADGRNHVIRKVTPQGKASDFVGKRWVTQNQLDWHWKKYSESGKFEEPSGIFYNFGGGLAFDSQGNLFFTADGRLYKFTKERKLVYFAGSDEGQIRDGKGLNARFRWPTKIAIDSNNTIYLCDSGAIRRTSPQGQVKTIAGRVQVSGYRDGRSAQALFGWLSGIAVDGNGNVFVSDTGNRVVRKITQAGIVSTFVGSRDWSYDSPFDATGKRARLDWPQNLTMDAKGNLFFSDEELLRKITPRGKVTTIGGKYRNPGRRDGAGEGALFGRPETTALAVDANGRVYVADSTSIRRGERVATKSKSK